MVLLKYVDDFFGIQRKGVRTRACDVLAVVFSAFGFQLDPRKSYAFEVALVVLGARVTICWMRRAVAFAVSEDKKYRWQADILACLKLGKMSPMQAEKYIGRLGWTAGLCADTCGRAFLKALWAQVMSPTPGYEFSS